MSPDLRPGFTFEWHIPPVRTTAPNLYHDTPFCLDMPDVLATGHMVGLIELACINNIMAYVDWPRGQSVGTMVHFSRLAATPPGMTRRLKFRREAWDEQYKIFEGTHERCIIAPEKFTLKIAEKKARAAL